VRSRTAVTIVLLSLLTALGCGLGSTAAVAPTQAAAVEVTDEPPTSAPEPTQAPTVTPTSLADAPTPTDAPPPPEHDLVESDTNWEPVIEEKDGVPMALVPAGCFPMGSTEEQAEAALALCNETLGDCYSTWFEDEMPQHKVCFDAPFWIDVYEVTNGQYGSSGEWSGDDLPRESVSWFDAVGYCASRGARIPTEAEWEYAARGPDGLEYPWGNDFDSTRANFCDSNCPYDWANAGFDDGNVNTAPVGSYPGGVSWVGAYDLSGNVWEWVGDWYDEDYYAASPGTNPPGSGSGDYKMFRGGSWGDLPSSVRTAYRGYINLDEANEHLGFRCAMTYQP
jgi:formylglycine-generating enzyme required for sulfatase activity